MATSARQKIALVFLGLILSLVLLEAGLRLGGLVLSSIQEYGNLQSIKQKGAYRILCLGESTTAGQYPHLLEQVLNQRNIGMRFSVIDKGRVKINTLFILNRVESYLAEYHPDLVVAMMGINDRGGHIPFEAPTTSRGALFIRSLRTYYLARLLWLHLLTKAEEIGGGKSDEDRRSSEKARTPFSRIRSEETFTENILAERSLEKAIELDPKNNLAYVELGRLYQDHGKYFQAENLFKKAIELEPKNDLAYVGLGRLYLRQGKLSQTEVFFKKAIELNSKNDLAYVGFGEFYILQDKSLQAEDSYKKAIELNPENENAYLDLGRLYWNQGKLSQAEASFKKAGELNPKNGNAYLRLGRLYKYLGKFQQAEDSFRKAIEINPEYETADIELAALYREQGKFPQAENVLEKAIGRNSNNERVLRAIASLCEEMGKPELAKKYAEKVNGARARYFAQVTINDYRKLKEILDRKGIKLVCVQYPIRNVGPLKRIFEKDKGVIFVDNERLFKEAVKRSSYKEYFIDMFA